MKKTSLIVSIALTQMLMADAMSDKASNNSSGSMMMQDSGVMNTSARPMIQGNDVYMFGQAIYWQPQEIGTNYARVSQPGGAASGQSVTNIEEKAIEFKWTWGFRAGIGYDMDYDQWDTKAYYTWLHTSREANASTVQQIATGPGTGFKGIVSSPVYLSQVSDGSDNAAASWELHYSVIDWDLGRAYMISKNLSMRPNIGVKGGWINQHLNGHSESFAGQTAGFTGSTKQTYKQKNDTWFVGPSFGVDSKWNLGNVDDHYFNLFGDLQGALMYGHYTNSYRQSGVVNGTLQYPSNRTMAMVVPMLKAMMGFGWDVNFNNDTCHFGLKLGYELQYWFGMNHMVQNAQANQAGDLAFQGGTVDVRFDF